jgi:hypothetical protein
LSTKKNALKASASSIVIISTTAEVLEIFGCFVFMRVQQTKTKNEEKNKSFPLRVKFILFLLGENNTEIYEILLKEEKLPKSSKNIVMLFMLL